MTDTCHASPAGGDETAAASPFARTWYGTVDVSRGLCALNLGVHVAAAAIVVALTWYRPPWIFLAPVVAGSYWHGLRGLRLQRRRSVCSICWRPDGTWLWQTRDGTECQGRLVAATVLARFFVLLRLRADGCRVATTTVALAGDSLPPAVHRHLRVRLTLWQPDAHGAGAWWRSHAARLKSLLLKR